MGDVNLELLKCLLFPLKYNNPSNSIKQNPRCFSECFVVKSKSPFGHLIRLMELNA
jgi:hypothetical protein